MQIADIPEKFNIPWANNAGPSYVRVIPQASQIAIEAGAASLTDGFPPLNFTPVAAGGVPPFGSDMNGIMRWLTEVAQWVQAGSAIGYYDPTFAIEIGGYPSGAMLQATSGAGNFWISTIDNNSNNPDTGGLGWSAFPGPTLVQPSVIQNNNATFDFNCDTMVSLGLYRASPAAMTVNLAATGTLITNQVFEIEDLSGNLDLGIVTVVPPSGHTIAGATNFTMNKQNQSCRFKYYGSNRWSVRSS